MSKITFRADDDLVRQLEEFDASKSEIMREALRAYLDDPSAGIQRSESSSGATASGDSIDDAIAERVDAVLAKRLDDAHAPAGAQDVNVHITVDGETQADPVVETAPASPTSDESSPDRPGDEKTTSDSADASERASGACSQCGEALAPGHVYCPNCGEKSSHRVFCDCGDELRSDWAFCPSCGKRTPAADVLDRHNTT